MCVGTPWAPQALSRRAGWPSSDLTDHIPSRVSPITCVSSMASFVYSGLVRPGPVTWSIWGQQLISGIIFPRFPYPTPPQSSLQCWRVGLCACHHEGHCKQPPSLKSQPIHPRHRWGSLQAQMDGLNFPDLHPPIGVLPLMRICQLTDTTRHER